MRVAFWVLAVISVVLLVAGFVSFCRDAAQKEAGEGDDDPESDGLVANSEIEWQNTRQAYLTAWDSLRGVPARLDLFAVASDRLALECRRAAMQGAVAPYLVRTGDAEPAYHLLPAELSDCAARPGKPEAWQPLDRALNRLAAIQDQTDAAVHADAHERVSVAARQLADQLGNARLPVDLEHCWFCQRTASDGTQLVVSPHACICERCVQACVEQLSDH